MNKYKWNKGAIVRVTRDLKRMDGTVIPKHSIMKIEKRLRGYHARRLAPPKLGIVCYSHDDFEEVPQEHWNAIFFQLNDFGDTKADPNGETHTPNPSAC